jgi:predicted O-methyltransferase YrrM
MTDALYSFVLKNAPLPHPILTEVAEYTAQRSDRNMQIAQDQGALLKLLCQLIHARRVVEIGCYTGYGAISLAAGLPDFGRVYTLDRNPETSAIAQSFFSKCDIGHRIELRLGSAAPELDKLLNEFGPASFDLAFIDADKSAIPTYFEKCLTLVRSNGLILVDNTIWSGRVVDPTDQSNDTVAIRKFCDTVPSDPRVDGLLLHISDGIYVLRKK